MNLKNVGNYLRLFGEFCATNMSAYKNSRNTCILRRNSELRGKYAGKRVVLFFTGNSADNVDFKLLRNEYVFGCNLLALHKNFKDLKVSFYSDLDTWSYRMHYFYCWLLEMIYIKTAPGAKVFLSASSYDFARKVPCFREDDTYYLGFDSRFNDAGEISIDIEKMTNIVTCGVFSSNILTAIYMGFKTIYLVGADYAKDPQITGHFYDGVRVETQPSAELIRNHEVINEFAEKRGVMIYNVVDDGFTGRIFRQISTAEFEELMRQNADRGGITV